jgi:ribosomal protein S6--L-glutamate ligase
MEWTWGLITAQARDDWHAKRLATALAATGDVEVLDPSCLRLVCGRSRGQDLLVALADGRDARRFDAVVLGRIVGPNADADLQLDAARALELIGIPCLNRVGPMLAAQDKLWTAAVLAKAGLPTPLCSSVARPEDALVAVAELGSAVAKPLFGSLGDGLFRVETSRERSRLVRRSRASPHLVQRFVPPGGVDYRLFVVGDRVEACIRREAPKGEFRSNVARGGRAVAAVATRLWREIAVESTRALGLSFGGVDLIASEQGPLVLEVNGFPNFKALHRATGRDMAEPIAREVLRVARAARKTRRTGRMRA